MIITRLIIIEEFKINSAALTTTSNDLLIFLFLTVTVLVSIVFLLTRIVPIIKFLLLDDIKQEESELIIKRTIKSLHQGKKIRLERISEKLNLSENNTLKLLKSSIPSEIKEKYLLIYTFPSFTLLKLPIEGHVCGICLNPIEINVYQQCLSCTRYFCFNHDYNQTEDLNACPECTGKLILFPKCCETCGLEFANVSQLPDLGTCTFCGSDEIISPFQVEGEVENEDLS